MDISVLVLQIVTILVSVTSLVVSFVSTLVENNKKNYIKVVTEQRLKNKESLRKGVSEILCLSHPCVLSAFDEESMKKCCACASEIESVLKRFYKEDATVLNAVDGLLDSLRQRLNGANSIDAVTEKRKQLLYGYSVYDFSDWQFIKSQANGKRFESGDFDTIYAQTKENISPKLF